MTTRRAELGARDERWSDRDPRELACLPTGPLGACGIREVACASPASWNEPLAPARGLVAMRWLDAARARAFGLRDRGRGVADLCGRSLAFLAFVYVLVLALEGLALLG